MRVDPRFPHPTLPAGAVQLCLWAVLLLADTLPLAGVSHAEATQRVRLVSDPARNYAPVGLEVPRRLISTDVTLPAKYRGMLLELSFYLPAHADDSIQATDFQLSTVKSKGEQLASMGGTVSPGDWIDMARQYHIDVNVDLNDYDIAATFSLLLKPVGLDESGRFERYVSARNDGPENPFYYRPVGSQDVMIKCLRGGFQNSRASLGATRNMHAAWSRASTMKPSRS